MPSALAGGLLLLVCARLSGALELSARGVAHSVLVRCATDGAFADRALSSTLSKAALEPRDARLATEITYGVLRNTRSLDFALEQLVAQLDRTSAAERAALRMGTFELLHMRTPDHAAVSQAVATASSKRSRGFLNGVLRNMARKRGSLTRPDDAGSGLSGVQALGVRCSMPDWLLRELSASVLREPAALCAWAEANQRAPRLALRVNPLRASAEEVAAALAAEPWGLHAEAVPGLPHALLLQAGGGEVARLPGFAEGQWSVQDPAAQLVGLLAAPRAGQTVLELCAAPGGKSTHLAEIMRDQGRVLAVEVSKRKLPLIAAASTRLRLRCISTHLADATDAAALRALLRAPRPAEIGGEIEMQSAGASPDDLGASPDDLGASPDDLGASPDDLGGELGLADCVVLDAPCSGFGTLRRNPEHRAEADGARLAGLHGLQDALLDAAACNLRVGGSLTYSVCTPLLGECDARVAAFLARHPGFVLETIDAPELQPYVTSCAGHGERTCVRTWTHTHGFDSFFAAKLRRES